MYTHEETPWRSLGLAIVYQAIEDYRNILRLLKSKVESEEVTEEVIHDTYEAYHELIRERKWFRGQMHHFNSYSYIDYNLAAGDIVEPERIIHIMEDSIEFYKIEPIVKEYADIFTMHQKLKTSIEDYESDIKFIDKKMNSKSKKFTDREIKLIKNKYESFNMRRKTISEQITNNKNNLLKFKDAEKLIFKSNKVLDYNTTKKVIGLIKFYDKNKDNLTDKNVLLYEDYRIQKQKYATV